MKVLFLLTFLPALIAAEFLCPDGTKCANGNACCIEDENVYKCCDINNKGVKLIPGLLTNAALNKSLMSPLRPDSSVHNYIGYCNGTECGYFHCCYQFRYATCCSNPAACCPLGYNCCKNEWCCPIGSRCAKTYKMCRSSAVTFAPTLATLGLLFVSIFISKKYIS